MEDEKSQQDLIDLGPILHSKYFFQLKPSSYQDKCLQINSDSDDSTGLRIYSAAHVAIRAIALSKAIFEGKDVCEIGCGVGAAGISTYFSAQLKSLVLTDGSVDAVAMAERNILHHGLQGTVKSRVLLWDSDFGDLHSTFDVVIGCELMYYRVDVCVLMSAVTRLLRESGLFFHAHIFRKPGLELELIHCLEDMGWSTLEIPLRESVRKSERQIRPDWYSVRCLVSASLPVIAQLQLQHPHWRIFEENISDSLYDSDGETEEDCDSIGLGSFSGH